MMGSIAIAAAIVVIAAIVRARVIWRRVDAIMGKR